MKKLTFQSILLLFLGCISVRGQFFAENDLSDSAKVTKSVTEFGLRFNGLAFFKNNEYFHQLAEGYTLPGFHVDPRFYFQSGEKFNFEAGVHLSQFSGKKGLNSVDPLFRATFSPSKSFSVLLGWLKGTTSHHLIEPLYQWEKMYTKPLEYGVQFLVDKPAFKLDTWIDWEKYIELDDPFQEELTFGSTSKILLFNESPFELWIPIQATVKHKGGQVVSVDIPLTTHVNWATGFNLVLSRNGSVVKRLMFDLYYTGFQDFSPQKRMAFKSGYGFYPSVTANIKSFAATLGYWRGHKFISPWGEPLFQSVSFTDGTVIIPDRYVIPIKVSFFKPVFSHISFGVYFESYYDLKLSQMDYAYGISMSFSGDLLIKGK